MILKKTSPDLIYDAQYMTLSEIVTNNFYDEFSAVYDENVPS